MYILLVNSKPLMNIKTLKGAMKITEYFKMLHKDKVIQCAKIEKDKWVLMWEEN